MSNQRLIQTQHVINESVTYQKCGRPVDSKDKNPRKRNWVNNTIKDVDLLKEIHILTSNRNVEENKTTEDNNEISISYVIIRKKWNQTNLVVDNIFAYNVALDIISKNEDSEPKSVEECR